MDRFWVSEAHPELRADLFQRDPAATLLTEFLASTGRRLRAGGGLAAAGAWVTRVGRSVVFFGGEGAGKEEDAPKWASGCSPVLVVFKGKNKRTSAILGVHDKKRHSHGRRALLVILRGEVSQKRFLAL